MSPCGLPIFSHRPFQRISLPLAQAASSMTGDAASTADLDDAGEIAGHAELVHAQNRLRASGDRRLDQRRIHVERAGLDVDEHRRGAAIADGVGRGDEGMADGDDLVAGADADRQQRQVQRRRAVGHRTGVRRADELANSRSNAATSGPCVTQPDRITRRTASTSRSSRIGLAIGICCIVSCATGYTSWSCARL